jgi:hypothetical protein
MLCTSISPLMRRAAARIRFAELSMTALVLAAILTLAGMVGCAQRADLIPAPDARTLEGTAAIARAEVAGVRVVATPDANQDPAQGYPYFQTIHLEIENESGVPMRLRYADISLVDETGGAMSALPTYLLQDVQVSPISHPTFYANQFRVAPHYVHHYPTFAAWPSRFIFDDGFYRHQYSLWDPYAPTQGMREQAIPEGVIDDGGNISGFVYFKKLDPEMDRVTLTMNLVNANTEDLFGSIRIPFLITEN